LKRKLLIPPAIAIGLSAFLLGTQERSISKLEQQCAVLQKALAIRTSGRIAETSTTQQKSTTKAAKDKERLDWKKTLAQLLEMKNSSDFAAERSVVKLEQGLQAMNKEELVAALDEIAILDLSKASRSDIEQMFMDLLAQKDPELALNHFIDRISGNEEIMGYQLSRAMLEWAKNDSAGAISWFDKQIAAGKFESKSLDGKSKTRLQFEESLFGLLLDSDFEAAERRLSALPKDQRHEVLRNPSSFKLKEENQTAFANLVREQIPEAEQTRIIAEKAAAIATDGGNYSKVTEFLTRIQATPAERTACVEQTAQSQILDLSYRKKITRNDLDTMREWVSTHAPELTNKITGEALANSLGNTRKTTFTETADLAAEYNAAAGNDDVLYSFLENEAVSDYKEEARILAEKTSNTKRREEILNALN
jgi:hypothetical protein